MKKIIALSLAVLMLLTALTSCRMPEVKDPFKEILEENPDMELPKSEVMEVDPEDIPQYELFQTYARHSAVRYELRSCQYSRSAVL